VYNRIVQLADDFGRDRVIRYPSVQRNNARIGKKTLRGFFLCLLGRS
jgi:hypothetical protein